jgi:hypothetical protein
MLPFFFCLWDGIGSMPSYKLNVLCLIFWKKGHIKRGMNYWNDIDSHLSLTRCWYNAILVCYFLINGQEKLTHFLSLFITMLYNVNLYSVWLLEAWNEWSFGPLERREFFDQPRNCMDFSRKTFPYEISQIYVYLFSYHTYLYISKFISDCGMFWLELISCD